MDAHDCHEETYCNKVKAKRLLYIEFAQHWKKDNSRLAELMSKKYCDNKGGDLRQKNKLAAKLKFYADLPECLKKCACGGMLPLDKAVSGQKCKHCTNHGKVKKIASRIVRKIKDHLDNISLRITLQQIRNGARRRGIPFDITIEDLDTPEFCPILGVKIIYNRLHRLSGAKSVNVCAPSVDRINPSLGYIKGNVAVISMRANRIKNDGTADEHQKVIDYIRKYSAVQHE